MKLPQDGLAKCDLLACMQEARAKDADWRGGKTFSLLYNAGDEVNELLDETYRLFLQSNALSLTAFPSLRRFEAEVLAVTADLLHGTEAAGTMTSGGTESICMAMKAAREWARAERPGTAEPEVVVPVTVHPAFHKAAHYFGVRAVTVPVGADYRADVAATEAAMTERTILVVGSAPCFPFGVVDPIPELAALAQRRGILMHVDACLGGYLLPFLERAGEPVAPFDFRVPGVTSMSADLHKYGYAAKGASVVLYRTRALRRHQFFAYADWPGGLYGSPSMAGSRGGGPIAAAWAVLMHLGERGFIELAKKTMAATRRFTAGIAAVDGLTILGHPEASIFAFGSDRFDVYALGEVLEEKGWRLDRQQRPASLHMMVSPAHEAVVDAFLDDLRGGAAAVAGRPPVTQGMAAMYGMLAALPDRGAVSRVILDFLDGFDRV